MEDKSFTVRCRRCGRLFVARYPNTLYCNYPSPDPDDNGRTCKQMRRIESKRKTRENQRLLQYRLANGDMISTDKFGYIERGEYMLRFEQALREKYNLHTYAEYQQWKTMNPELVGEEYEAFQKETGLHMVF